MIALSDIGKRFDRDWIFRHVNIDIQTNDTLAILGSNGSGKSTLLKIISGKLLPTEGSISYFFDDNSISSENIFKRLSIAAPYMELPEELTLNELYDFHFSFKKPFKSINFNSFLSICELNNHRNKFLHDFSSGMKQRVKLALAILSISDILLLDEPCSNLDSGSIEWYLKTIETYANRRTIIVCSNHQIHEHQFCKRKFDINAL